MQQELQNSFFLLEYFSNFIEKIAFIIQNCFTPSYLTQLTSFLVELIPLTAMVKPLTSTKDSR